MINYIYSKIYNIYDINKQEQEQEQLPSKYKLECFPLNYTQFPLNYTLEQFSSKYNERFPLNYKLELFPSNYYNNKLKCVITSHITKRIPFNYYDNIFLETIYEDKIVESKYIYIDTEKIKKNKLSTIHEINNEFE